MKELVKRSKKRAVPIVICLAASVVLVVTASLYYNGILQINSPSEARFSIKGADISAYQGEIDWSVFSSQDIDFTYIKATEGSSFTDERFVFNWEEASNTELRIGAYHFFSFESPGKAQAKHFCDTVPAVDNMLPPVIDVEPYGEFKNKNVDFGDTIGSELTDCLSYIEEKYGVKPVIYTTKAYYNSWIKESFPGYDIWIRSVYGAPDNDIEWRFWQYSNRMRLKGYDGEEKYIDMNVFNGSFEEFSSYGS